MCESVQCGLSAWFEIVAAGIGDNSYRFVSRVCPVCPGSPRSLLKNTVGCRDTHRTHGAGSNSVP